MRVITTVVHIFCYQGHYHTSVVHIFYHLPHHLTGLRRLEIDSDDLTELGRPPLLPSSPPAPVLLVELPAPVVAPRFRDLKQKTGCFTSIASQCMDLNYGCLQVVV